MSSSSIPHQDPITIIGNTLMRRAVKPNLSIVVVEGGGDFKVFNSIFNKTFCTVLPIKGRDNVYKSIEYINMNNIEGVIAIADKDFDEITNTLKIEQNLFYTDTHDIETLILNTNILEQFLTKFIDEDSIFLTDIKKSIENIFLTASKIAYARLYSILNSHDLKFNDTPLLSYLEIPLNLNCSDYISNLVNHATNKAIRDLPFHDREKLISAYEAYMNQKVNHDFFILCRGHDLMELINYLISFNITKKTFDETDELEDNLYPLYKLSLFRNTKLYKDIMTWLIAHPKYRIIN